MARTRRHLARRRRRLALVAPIAFVALIASLPSIAHSSGANAQATIAATGDGQVDVSVGAAVASNETTVTGGSISSDLAAFGGSSATCSSFVSGGSLVSTSEVDASNVSLLGGIVTAGRLVVVAKATAGSGSAGASTSGSSVSGLVIQGVASSQSTGQVQLPGVGTLSILALSSDGSGGEGQARVTGLRLDVTSDGVTSNGVAVPAGTVVIVGTVWAQADLATLDALVGTPTPSPSATHTPTPRPTATRTTHPSATHTAYPTGQATIPASSWPTYTPMPAATPPAADVLGRFPGAVFPVVGTYTYTDTFGAARSDMPQGHQGDDIFAAYGSPVVAVQDGVLTMSTYGIGGNNLHLTTDQGDYFYYAHLSRFATGMQQGQRVVAGQTIGYVGTTGDAQGTPPHLHFEIHPNGGPAVDPTPYLDAWRSAGHVVSSGQQTMQSAPTEQTQSAATGTDVMQQMAANFAALQASITSGTSNVPHQGGGADPVGVTFLLLNTAGAVLIKRLQLGAALLL